MVFEHADEIVNNNLQYYQIDKPFDALLGFEKACEDIGKETFFAQVDQEATRKPEIITIRRTLI